MTDQEPTPAPAPALPPSYQQPAYQQRPTEPDPPQRRGSSLPYILAGSLTAVAAAVALVLVVLSGNTAETASSAPAQLQVDDAEEALDDASEADTEEAGDSDPEQAPPETEPEQTTLPPTTQAPLVGDLGLVQAIQNPTCTPSDPIRFVVISASLTTPATFAADTQTMLNTFPGSAYLRTDATGCTSLRQDLDGVAIYAVFYGPYETRADACSALITVGRGSYIKPLHSGDVAQSINASDC